MKGSDFAQSLPEKDVATRERMILQAVKNHQIVVDWVPVTVSVGSITAVYEVSADVLKVGEPDDCIRFGISQYTGQLIADQLGAVLPTMKLSDQIFKQADLKLIPKTRGWFADGTMAWTSRMLEQSAAIDRDIGSQSYQLVAGHHKDWVNTAMLGMTAAEVPKSKDDGLPASVNYGWHSLPGSGAFSNRSSETDSTIRIVQGPGTQHNFHFADYSQYIRLVSRRVIVCSPAAISGLGSDGGESCTLPDGSTGVMKEWDIYDMPDREGLRPVLTHEGNMLMRHPAVEWEGGEPIPFVDRPPTGYGGGSGNGPFMKLAALAAGAAVGYYGVRYLEHLARRGVFSR